MLDKVVEGLEICTSDLKECPKNCPYYGVSYCKETLDKEALGHLKEYQRITRLKRRSMPLTSMWHYIDDGELPTTNEWHVCKLRNEDKLKMVLDYKQITPDKYEAWAIIRFPY